MKACPECKSQHVHRSHSHNLWERMQKSFTTKRLFRCHDCGWRGWLETGRHKSVLHGKDLMSLGPTMLVVAIAVAIGILILMGVLFRK